jgi:2-(3-amino-3-carboxypropyl)histidine synthase
LGTGEAFDLRPDYISDVIRKSGVKTVGFQLPEGLKRKGAKLEIQFSNVQLSK